MNNGAPVVNLPGIFLNLNNLIKKLYVFSFFYSCRLIGINEIFLAEKKYNKTNIIYVVYLLTSI